MWYIFFGNLVLVVSSTLSGRRQPCFCHAHVSFSPPVVAANYHKYLYSKLNIKDFSTITQWIVNLWSRQLLMVPIKLQYLLSKIPQVVRGLIIIFSSGGKHGRRTWLSSTRTDVCGGRLMRWWIDLWSRVNVAQPLFQLVMLTSSWRLTPFVKHHSPSIPRRPHQLLLLVLTVAKI